MLVKRIILLFFVLFLSSSYNSQGLQSERIPQAESASAEAAAIPPLDEKRAVELYEQALSEFMEFWYGDMGCEDPNIPDDLPDDLIKSLVTEAANRFFHTKEGGALPNAKCDDRIITVNGKGGYQFFCEPLDTMDKLKAYLSEVFTDEIVDQLIAELNLVIVDNKIAMQTLGVVGGIDWEHATFKMIKREGNFYSYECTVPITGSDDSELRRMVLFKDPKTGWKVASDPGQLK
ncbi:DL-endopeptidase inhibitor IseA family protein [Paenibacillus tyrfis]|uniref:DL-endopeptidase inhibitor IseA family protein n=1 Tax=Paenibacillus tyrfis TaxID=1501230 RepID=UPI0015C68C71|nr:DL-endopeptidase inhibitor IseA family protein [Paenibacillus tyrfis]